nr:MurR/RpiR family transcriptional regulator [Olegusella massiliensis]
MDFYKAVADNSSKLNDLEETILRRLIASEQSISEISVKDLANEFYTAPNTITRLCHKLGFGGFVDLRTSYLTSLAAARYSAEDTSLNEQIRKTQALIHMEHISAISHALANAENVVFLASGLSALPCEDMCRKLLLLNKNSHVYLERHVMTHAAKQAHSNDVFFAVSISGDTKVSVDAAAIAKSKGAIIVSLTGLSKNPLSKIADYPLYVVERSMTYDGMDLNSRLPFYYLLELIFESYFDLQVQRKDHQSQYLTHDRTQN